MEWENVLPWLCLRDPPGVACLVRRDVARTLRTLVLLILFIHFIIFFHFMYFQHDNYFSSSVSPSKVTLSPPSPPFLCDSSVVSTRSTISFSLSHPLLSVNLRISPLSPSLSCLRPCFSLSTFPSLFLPSIFFLGFSRVCRSPVILLGNTIGMDGFKFWFRLQLHRRSSALFSNDSFPAHCSHVGVRKVRDCTTSHTAT